MIQQSYSWAYVQKRGKLFQKDTCTPMFISLFSRLAMSDSSWPRELQHARPPNVHSSTVYNSQDMEVAWMFTDRWMNKEDVVNIHNGIYSAIIKNEMMPFPAIWTDLKIIILSEVSQRKISILGYHLYEEYKKKWYKWIY